jgi:hypothetical protein
MCIRSIQTPNPAFAQRRGRCRGAKKIRPHRQRPFFRIRLFAFPPLPSDLKVLELESPDVLTPYPSLVPVFCKELNMIALFKGLGLLLQDNELYNSPFEKQVAHWKHLSEEQIREEVAVLAKAKCQWLISSIIGWQAASLLILGLISNYLWRDDFHITFTRVVIIFGSWVSILFVIWFMANMFDQTAGFERWMKAFNSRARITSDADSVENVADALEMLQHYPEVLDYKQAVSAKRELRHEDIRIMRELGRMRQHSELVGKLNHVGDDGMRLQPAF